MIVAIRLAVLAVCLLVPTLMVHSWVGAAKERVAAAESAPQEPGVAIAAAADEAYCSPELKRILRRVLQSCGLAGAAGTRGCQPLQAKNVATMSGNDFNALFEPMKDRGGIVEFDLGKSELDASDLELIDRVFADQRGASWFFVVARASPEGATGYNRELSRARAEAVMAHLRDKFHDPDLDKEVGLLWLGEEFAQLDKQFCEWRRSSTDACKPEEINRSAFIAWIDCRF